MTDPAEVIRWALEVEPGANPEAMDALDVLTAKADLADRYREALAAYESAVQKALAAVPAHWQRYRDPFELRPDISAARRIGKDALAAAGSEPAPPPAPHPDEDRHGPHPSESGEAA